MKHTGIRMTTGHDGVSGGKVNEVLRQVFANSRMNVTFDGTYERVARPEF